MHLLLAASENPVVPELIPLITTIVIFGVAFYILKEKVWPKITQGLDDRDEKIRSEIRSAEAAREQANVALREYEASLATARKEAAEMIAAAKTSAKAAAEELRQRNEAELADMKQRAARDITAAKESAIGELHAEATALATAIAGKILQREISVEDQQRLIDESLQSLQTANGR